MAEELMSDDDKKEEVETVSTILREIGHVVWKRLNTPFDEFESQVEHSAKIIIKALEKVD